VAATLLLATIALGATAAVREPAGKRHSAGKLGPARVAATSVRTDVTWSVAGRIVHAPTVIMAQATASVRRFEDLLIMCS